MGAPICAKCTSNLLRRFPYCLREVIRPRNVPRLIRIHLLGTRPIIEGGLYLGIEIRSRIRPEVVGVFTIWALWNRLGKRLVAEMHSVATGKRLLEKGSVITYAMGGLAPVGLLQSVGSECLIPRHGRGGMFGPDAVNCRQNLVDEGGVRRWW